MQGWCEVAQFYGLADAVEVLEDGLLSFESFLSKL